jgi:Putative addiction module component
MPEDETDESVEAAWAREIRRRVAAVRAGELESENWRIVLDRVEKEILGR